MNKLLSSVLLLLLITVFFVHPSCMTSLVDGQMVSGCSYSPDWIFGYSQLMSGLAFLHMNLVLATWFKYLPNVAYVLIVIAGITYFLQSFGMQIIVRRKL